MAFTAYPTSVHYYDAGDVIIFDAVEINIGGYFQTDTSMSTCAHHGVYLFSWTLSTYFDNRMSADIYIDNESKYFQTYTDTADYQSQSMTVIIECNSNEKYR